LNSFGEPPRQTVEKLVLLLSPFAPHLSEELWELLGHRPSIADVEWPSWEERLTVEEQIELPVQVNGRVRGRVLLAPDASPQAAEQAALADENVKKYLGGKPPRKVVYVPGRILNLIGG
jgi:leucyl-tRNA synthetase